MKKGFFTHTGEFIKYKEFNIEELKGRDVRDPVMEEVIDKANTLLYEMSWILDWKTML